MKYRWQEQDDKWFLIIEDSDGDEYCIGEMWNENGTWLSKSDELGLFESDLTSNNLDDAKDEFIAELVEGEKQTINFSNFVIKCLNNVITK